MMQDLSYLKFELSWYQFELYTNFGLDLILYVLSQNLSLYSSILLPCNIDENQIVTVLTVNMKIVTFD